MRLRPRVLCLQAATAGKHPGAALVLYPHLRAGYLTRLVHKLRAEELVERFGEDGPEVKSSYGGVCAGKPGSGAGAHPDDSPPRPASVGDRSHKRTCAGCTVFLTTPTSSLLSASRSVSSRSFVEKASRVFLASYFLR